MSHTEYVLAPDQVLASGKLLVEVFMECSTGNALAGIYYGVCCADVLAVLTMEQTGLYVYKPLLVVSRTAS